MKLASKLFALSTLAALLVAAPAHAQWSTTNDQSPLPVPSAAVQASGSSENLLQTYTVPGGALYQACQKPPGAGAAINCGALSFVPGGASSGINRFQPLTDGKSALGVPLTAAAGTPSGAVGVSRTAGTSLVLVGEATSGSAKTDKVMFELNTAATYIAGANIPIVVNANYTGGGTITAVSTTLTVLAYSEVAGVETALTVSAAQQFTGTAANYTFTVTGTGLVVGSHIVVEVDMLVTSASGANTGQINSVALTM